jgi:hypothetical protein
VEGIRARGGWTVDIEWRGGILSGGALYAGKASVPVEVSYNGKTMKAVGSVGLMELFK